MEKYKESDVELLTSLLELQERTSPIRLSIGYIGDNDEVYQGIILHEAPSIIIETLIERGYICSLNKYGMRVYKL